MNGPAVVSAYTPRHVVAIDPMQQGDWTLKVYWISVEQAEADDSLVEPAVATAFDALEGAPGYGAGFLLVHRGEMATWVILWWWTEVDILRRRIWQFTEDGFVEVSDQHYVACVWELSIVDWERKAWINHVLRHPKRPRPQGYLTSRYPSSHC